MKFRLTYTVLLTAIILGSFSTLAQERFDLSDCLMFTLNNSPKLRSEKLSQEKETISLYEQKSSFLPQVDAFLNYYNYFNDLPTYIFPQEEGSNLAGIPLTGPYPVPLGLRHNLNTGFEISQTLFDMNFFGNNAMNQHFQSYQEIKLSMAEEEMLYQVAVLFYQIAINEEKSAFLDMNLERLGKLQSIVKLQADQGFAKQTDYDKLLVKTSNLKSKKNKLNAGIKQQLSYLKLMMGMSREEAFEIQYEENNTWISMEKGDILEEKMLEEQRELNKMNAKKINADYYPRLQAYAAFLFQAQRERLNFFESNQDWYNVHQWGLKLTVPIMRGFEKKNKKEISEIVDAQLAFGLEQKQEQGQLEYENAIAELEVTKAEQVSQQENVALAERVYTQSELSYEQGTMLLMDFLDSEATLRESKMIYATTLLDIRLAELKILKASGKLKELVNR
ncbi:MAG: TolC family protein [Cyclobacteriaceae bacterium]|nr:TolC family protein [Cyclobacteriaceae bacterium]